MCRTAREVCLYSSEHLPLFLSTCGFVTISSLMRARIQRALDASFRPLLGDDVFISYSRQDASTYAAGLASELAHRGLSCRFDQWGSEPGKEVPAQILRALRRSGLLVVIGTIGATHSASIDLEIRTFIKTKRLIVPIDIDGSMREASWWPLILGLPISEDQPGEQGSEREPAHTLPTKPSSEVLDRVENSITFTKRNARLRRIAAGTLVILAILVAAAFVALHRASTAALEVSRQTQLAAQSAKDLARAELKRSQADALAQKALSAQQDAKKKQTEAERSLATSRREYDQQKKITASATRDRIAAEEKKAEAERLLADAQVKVKEQTAIADSRKLARQALDAPSTNYQLALETAVKAVETYPSQEAIVSLTSAIKGLDREMSMVLQPSIVSTSDDGKLVAVASPLGDARLIDTERHLETPLCGLAAPVKHLAFSPAGHDLLAVRQEGQNSALAIQIWDTQTRRLAGTAHLRSHDINLQIWFVPGETRFIVGTFSERLRLFDLPSGRLMRELEGTNGHDRVVFNPKNPSFLSYKESLPYMADPPAIWNANAGELLWRLNSGRPFESAAFDSAGNSLLAQWSLDPGKPSGFTLLTLDEKGVPTQSQPYDRLVFDYANLAAYHLPQFRFTIDDALHNKYPQLVQGCRDLMLVDPKGRIALCGQGGKAPLIFELTGLRLVGPLDRWTLGGLDHAEFSPDGSVIAFVDYNGVLGVWSAVSRGKLWTTQALRGRTAFSSDGRRLFIWDSTPGIIKVFETASGKLLHTLTHPNSPMVSSAASTADLLNVLWLDPKGEHAITRTEHAILFWDVDQEQILYTRNLFEPDRQHLAQDRQDMDAGAAGQLLAIAKQRLQTCE